MIPPDLAEWAFPNRATAPGSSAYYSVRLAPVGARDALAALFGWRHEVGDVLVRVSDPGIARLKLDWWRQEADRTAAGRPGHPVGRLLIARLPNHALPAAPFHAIIDRVEADLRGQWPPDDLAWAAAAAADLGALFALFCRADGRTDADLLAGAWHLGGWCAQVRWLRDAGLRLRQGRAVLPAARLDAAGFSPGRLTDPDGRAALRAVLPALLAPLAAELVATTPRRADLGTMPVAVRCQVRIHAALLAELRASALLVTDQRIGLTPLRKLWLAWRAR